MSGAMKPTEIESWALSVIDRVQAGQPVEDVRVELKSEWPKDEHGVARRIAGHANAAHGEPILWLIGIDERNGQVVGADHHELSNWWSRVQSFFAELPPGMIDLNVPYDGKTIVALLFEIERRPFVVKVPGGGHIDLEVPWRDGTRIRSAERRELITILVAACKNPSVEVLKGTLEISQNLGSHYAGPHGLRLDVYIEPRSAERVVIPFHHCEGTLRFPFAEMPFPFGPISFAQTRKRPSSMIACSGTEVVVDGPGPVTICAVPPDLATLGRIAFSPTAQVELKLWPTGSEVPVPVIADLTEVPLQDGAGRQYAVS